VPAPACRFRETCDPLPALAGANDGKAITLRMNRGYNGRGDGTVRPCPQPEDRLSRSVSGPAALLRAAVILAGMAMPALAQPGVTPIRFAPGTSSAEVSGGVERGGRAIYALGARAGQTMRLRVTAVEHNVAVQVWLPGATLPVDDPMGEITGETLPGAGEGQDATAWSGRLPRSGTYLVVVGPTRGGATYRLHVSIN
jgi:hypothetical protein